MGFLSRFKTPKATVSLKTPIYHAELGEDLEGVITVVSQEEFDATEIRAELRCIEKQRKERWVYNKQLRRNIRQVYWDQATLHSSDPVASGQIHIVPGFKKDFPIVLSIPIAGRDSFDGMDANVTWFVKAVVAVDDRPDITSQTIEIQVIRTSAVSKTQEKEIVMVPCVYCECLMVQTSSFCPKCGAPRKA
ncbi:hypothetical protein AC477_00690 [miscellaneous Crenarchaeota group-1 archaeon SG8-32-1]|uniref:Arrestin-like N-terminal domain-containing protein n=1 Tax=miscellaneous Crenarchaeota group-1 archaeon SG8-32-1 TaxID=1685124 RepID=A0A0M0C0B1_9ARCH|nr:MAG: hypothetical protein AC477_00690 [miscellaneous Crenarchaeota group-1 archaeon SG8-32-1]